MDKERREVRVLREQEVNMSELIEGDIFRMMPTTNDDDIVYAESFNQFHRAISDPYPDNNPGPSEKIGWTIKTEAVSIVKSFLPFDLNLKKWKKQ